MYCFEGGVVQNILYTTDHKIERHALFLYVFVKGRRDDHGVGIHTIAGIPSTSIIYVYLVRRS
jgi:hypothetical protein